MSIQFGVWNISGSTVDRDAVVNLGRATDRQALDGTAVVARQSVGMGLQPFITHARAKLGPGPALFADGCMLTLDGRIDNHAELRQQYLPGSADVSDSTLVAAIYRQVGADCFRMLIGDWAIVLWSAREEALYLARDHAGTRTLYFEQSKQRVLWSTELDTFRAEGALRELDLSYSARYLCCLPLRNLTPYRGIRAVPPAHSVRISLGGFHSVRHWEPVCKNILRYQSDQEYETHFLSLLRQSVRRRTGDGAPIIAELSGGLDSSSIVCISDALYADAGMPTSAWLDTISYFDDAEPNWNERRYFSLVEKQRGKSGIHLDIASENRSFEPLDVSREARPTLPGLDRFAASRQRQLQEVLTSGRYRVLLSGIGGDELLGGVPTAVPELADALMRGQLKLLISRALAFCLLDRTPILHLLAKCVALSASSYLPSFSKTGQVPPWIPMRLRHLAYDASIDQSVAVPRLGFLPSRIENGISWWELVETLPHLYPASTTRYEYRYPYLDRDLVEFLYQIPREQLVRPGRRRSLMRRALQEIVPSEILERRRKGSVIRGPLLAIQRSEPAIRAIFANSLLASKGLIEADKLRGAIGEIARGSSPRWWPALLKAIHLEFWLRSQADLAAEFPRPRSALGGLSLKRRPKEIRASNAVG